MGLNPCPPIASRGTLVIKPGPAPGPLRTRTDRHCTPVWREPALLGVNGPLEGLPLVLGLIFTFKLQPGPGRRGSGGGKAEATEGIPNVFFRHRSVILMYPSLLLND